MRGSIKKSNSMSLIAARMSFMARVFRLALLACVTALYIKMIIKEIILKLKDLREKLPCG